jgi:hypothetical protein
MKTTWFLPVYRADYKVHLPMHIHRDTYRQMYLLYIQTQFRRLIFLDLISFYGLLRATEKINYPDFAFLFTHIFRCVKQ